MASAILLYILLNMTCLIAALLAFDNSRAFFAAGIKSAAQKRTQKAARFDFAMLVFLVPIAVNYPFGARVALAVVVLEIIIAAVLRRQAERMHAKGGYA